jgi:hypothetical protein
LIKRCSRPKKYDRKHVSRGVAELAEKTLLTIKISVAKSKKDVVFFSEFSVNSSEQSERAREKRFKGLSLADHTEIAERIIKILRRITVDQLRRLI